MKKILLLFAAVAIAGCSSQKATTDDKQKTNKGVWTLEKAEESKEIRAEDLVKDASGNLSGIQKKGAFMTQPYAAWFQPRYDSYQPDAQTLASIKENMDGVTVRAYMGTWCGDSKRETPKFYSLLDKIDFNYDDLTMVTVDRTKKQPVELVEDYNIMRVPTFIFYENGQEIGRFVERPRESLEADILKIVSGQEYKHYYDRS